MVFFYFVYIYIYIYSNDNYLLSQELTYYSFARMMSRLVSNYRYYFALLSIEHFLHCSLVALTVFFSFDQPIACLLIFFNWYDQVGLFFFLSIYIFFP